MWIGRLFKRRAKPEWDTLTREEQGIILRNSQPQSHGDSAKAFGSAGMDRDRRSGW